MKLGMMAAGALLVLPALATGQGLGDAAKKEKERRQTQKSGAPAKTYTQDEVLALPPTANEGAGTGNASGATTVVGASPAVSSVTPPAPDGDGRQRDEQLWRGRVAMARQRIEKAQAVHQRLSGLHLVPGYVFEDSRGRVVIHSIGQLQDLTARAKAELDEAQKALENLLEEARRASIPPGWLR